MRDITHWALLCTTNDPESLTIVRIARALGIPLIESCQKHGATLAQEPHLFSRILAVKNLQHFAIIEIPGPNDEQKLRDLGIDVHIIDHHTYPELDRMKDDASLTQFLHLFQITDDDLRAVGFDTEIIRGVALIDQGFLWELAASTLSQQKQRETRAYYLACKRDIDPQYEATEAAAREAWDAREVQNAVVIVRSLSALHVREAVAFLLADAFPQVPPTSIVCEGDGRVSVQETDNAPVLFQRYGGFLFGKKRCWGMVGEDCPPTVNEIMANIRP